MVKIKFRQNNRVIKELNALPLLREPPEIEILSEGIEGVRIIDNQDIYIRWAKKLSRSFRLSLLLFRPVDAIKLAIWTDNAPEPIVEEIKTIIPIHKNLPHIETRKSYHIRLPIMIERIKVGNNNEPNEPPESRAQDGCDDIVQKIINDEVDIIWVIGGIGFGKTTLAKCISDALRDKNWEIKGDPTSPEGWIARMEHGINDNTDLKDLTLQALNLPNCRGDCDHNIIIVLDEYDILYRNERISLSANRSVLTHLLDYVKCRLTMCQNVRTVLIGLEPPTEPRFNGGTCDFLKSRINGMGLRMCCCKLRKFEEEEIKRCLKQVPLPMEKVEEIASTIWDRTKGHPMLVMTKIYIEMEKYLHDSTIEICDAVKYCAVSKSVAGRYVRRFLDDEVMQKLKSCVNKAFGKPLNQLHDDKIMHFLESQGLCYKQGGQLMAIPLLKDCDKSVF